MWFAALLLSIPVVAHAASLGQLVVLSSLEEPLQAEIEVFPYGDGADPAALLQPRLAPPERYVQANFPWNPALAASRLLLRQQPNGRHVIEFTSSRQLREPLVYLLIDLEGPTTRYTRSYAVTIGPAGDGGAVVMPQRVPDTGTRMITASRPETVSPLTVSPRPREPRPPVTAAAGIPADLSRQLQRLESESAASAKTLAGLIERVAAMEQTVARMQRELAMPGPAAVPQQPAAVQPPVVKPPAPAAAPLMREQSAANAELPPRRARSWTDSILNEGLLVLAGGLLVLLVGLGYWMMWGRPPLKESLPKSGE